MITVLADQNHYQLEPYLHPSIRYEAYDPLMGWSADQLRNADALLVRTTSPLREGSLPDGCKLSFVGTASAGRDHLDEAWLTANNIHIADAKGSNARSVAEYVAVTVLHYLESTGQISKTTGQISNTTGKGGNTIGNAGRTTGQAGNTTKNADDTTGKPATSGYPETTGLVAGIIGAGYTGTAVTEMLESIGIRCIQYDPPRERRELNADSRFRSASLDEVLSCDILSFHVPLERTGRDATWHWYDEEKIRSYPKKLVINASRGGVMDESALLQAHRDGHISHYICDVWENEPVFNDEIARHALVATPHIAGYSVEAKLEATRMICRQLHRFFSLSDPEVPQMTAKNVEVPKKNLSLTDIIRILHPVFFYDKSLRALSGLPDSEKGSAFLKLRQDIPLRHEFRHLALPGEILNRYPVLQRIGIAT